MAFTQDNRLLAVNTPLGKDVLLLTAFKGMEGISRLFDFELTMLSENHSISFEAIIGQKVTISVALADGGKRYFNGIVSSFSQGRGGGQKGGDPRFSYYGATVVPWTWLLTRTADSRIFQKKSVPDIIKQIFSEKGFSDFSDRLSKTYNPKEYCVQYRETDFNFISRLMEEEGIWYFYEHEDGKHMMVLADDPGQHKPCPNQSEAHYQISAGGWMARDIVTGFEKIKEIRPGKYTLNDYDFKKPKTDLKSEVPTNQPLAPQPLAPPDREIYDHPGRYEMKSDGERLTKLRMEAEEMQITTINGSSICRAFTSGYKFTILDHYRQDVNNKDYVLVTIEHDASHATEYSGTDALSDESFAYSNRFTCIPQDITFRPPLMTPKPVVRGAHSAFVVGPKGEEIYTDEHGRVKVQFHWDREGKNDENSSCWMRVSQLWAGQGWGAMYIPRIGHEVLVDFFEGDPDKPIITGRVYHGINKPPYPLPAEKTKSTIKSDSTIGGGGNNEFRFEDKKGQEEVYLHGQKDWNILIENDKGQTIGHDETMLVKHNRTKTVQVDQSETIGNNKTIQVGVNHTESIGKDETLSVGNNRSKTIGVNQQETIGANKTIQVGVNHSETIGANMSLVVGSNKIETVAINSAEMIGAAKEITIGGLYQLTVGAAMNETVGASKSESVANNLTINVGDKIIMIGDNEVTVSSKKINISASQEIVIGVGANSIKIDAQGISIGGIKINSTAVGMHEISGALVKIN